MLLKDVSVLGQTFLNLEDGSVKVSLVGNIISLIVSKQKIMDVYIASSSTLFSILAIYIVM